MFLEEIDLGDVVSHIEASRFGFEGLHEFFARVLKVAQRGQARAPEVVDVFLSVNEFTGTGFEDARGEVERVLVLALPEVFFRFGEKLIRFVGRSGSRNRKGDRDGKGANFLPS